MTQELTRLGHIHFIGIGGIGMSGIAEILLDLGYKVSGSDLGDNPVITKLKAKGAIIYQGHAAYQIEGATIVVYSSAVKTTNPEFAEAVIKSIPIMKRAEMLAQLMKLKKGIAIAGSHGKTTTTSLVASIFDVAKKDATHIIGGIVSNLGGNARSGKGEYLIAEADESDGSFLLLNPEIVAITNIDNDHLDHYGTKDKIEEAFIQFINQVPFFGKVILNFDDVTIQKLKSSFNRPSVWFSLHSLSENYCAQNIAYSANGSEFDLFIDGQYSIRIMTPVWGEHNVSNSLASIALAHQLGIELSKIQAGLNSFKGVGRRLEKIYQDENLLIIDDYAHHPTEINATLSSIRKVDDRKLIGVFEPHRYSRMSSFWNEFQASLSLLDEVYILPIYEASEAPLEGITSEAFTHEMNENGKKTTFIEKDKVLELFQKNKQTSHIIVTLGAGSISKIAREAVLKL